MMLLLCVVTHGVAGKGGRLGIVCRLGGECVVSTSDGLIVDSEWRQRDEKLAV